MKTPPSSTEKTRRAWVEVDLGALRRNFRGLQDRVGGEVGLLPMVKADGYGLGGERTARALTGLDPWAFGVASVDEGRELRRAGIEDRIVVFSPCAPGDGDELAASGLQPAVSSVRALRTLADASSRDAPLPIHLEVDTGIGRFGVVASEPDRWIPPLGEILRESSLELVSTFTHFHSAEEDRAATRDQARVFREVLATMREGGIDPGTVHLANSAAILEHGSMDADVVRPGLRLYGGLGGETVAAVRARVLDVRRVPAGHAVSYGATYRTHKPTRLATLGIGYGDGLRRDLSNRGEVLVEGRRTPIRGAVCMDVTVVDVTDVEAAQPGDVATVLGKDGDEEIGLEEMARQCGTIPYEILTGLGRRLPRLETAR